MHLWVRADNTAKNVVVLVLYERIKFTSGKVFYAPECVLSAVFSPATAPWLRINQWFRLPSSVPKFTPAKMDRKLLAPTPGSQIPEVRTPRILYIEDSLTSQLLMKRYVHGLGELSLATSLGQASLMLEDESFDLVVTDFLLPGGDSTVLIHQIRQNQRTSHIPIIVVSGTMDRALLGKVIKAGANDGLPKPINVTEFRDMVQKMLFNPYFRNLGDLVLNVVCFAWRQGDLYHQYSPELQLAVSGATAEEASAKMQSEISSRASKGVEMGITLQEKIVTHFINL
jgi:CheY-like chemotaxis protein